MKKNILLITVTLALSLSWVGCNKSGKLSKTSKFTPPPSSPVLLKLKWPVGERVVQSFDLKQNMEIFMPNQPASIKQDMNMGQEYGLSVLNEDANGGHEIEMEFLSARMSMQMKGKTMFDYDSAQKSADGKVSPVADVFQKIIGAKIQYFMDASNNVQRVEGVDDLTSRLTSGGSPNATAPFRSIFSEGYFKQMMSSSRYLPSASVQPGDTWPVQTEIAMGPLGVMVMDYTFTFQKWEQLGKRNCARLEFRGTIKSKPDQNPTSTGMAMSIQDGNASGVSWFDPELGKIIRTALTQDMTMIMTLPANARGYPAAGGRAQTITNIMNQVITVKLESVK